LVYPGKIAGKSVRTAVRPTVNERCEQFPVLDTWWIMNVKHSSFRAPLPTLAMGVSAYLADWHRAFAALDPAASIFFELWFDRGQHLPVVETIRIPRNSSTRDRHVIALYLSVLINNILCVYGARRVSIISKEAELPLDILAAMERNLFQRLDSFSNMSLLFLHALVERVFHAGFVMDTDRMHAAVLREALDEQARAPHGGGAESERLGTSLAVNIGQRLTSWGVVTLDGRGQHGVERFTRLESGSGGPEQAFGVGFETLMAEIRQTLGEQTQDIKVIGISIAATVVSGDVQPVGEFGLFAGASREELEGVNEHIRRVCRSCFPGRPVVIVNDGEAQALFAFHFAGGRGKIIGADSACPVGTGKHLLSLRLGACPCVHFLDAQGKSPVGVYEYSWLITNLNTTRSTKYLCSTIRFHLSFYGVAAIAHELGLLEKYLVDPLEAIFFFPEKLVSDDPTQRKDAKRIYHILGAHVAMLVCEIHRRHPLGAVMLLGSLANRIDRTVFPVMRDGFTAFIDEHARDLGSTELVLVDDASSQASLVGAAYAALRPESIHTAD